MRSPMGMPTLCFVRVKLEHRRICVRAQTPRCRATLLQALRFGGTRECPDALRETPTPSLTESVQGDSKEMGAEGHTACNARRPPRRKLFGKQTPFRWF